MNLFKTISFTSICLTTLAGQAQEQKKSWSISGGEPAINAPFVQVDYTADDGKYYFKHTTRNDSEFVFELYDKLDGKVIKTLNGRYLKKGKLWGTYLCDSIWVQIGDGKSMGGSCYCSIEASKHINNGTPGIYGHFALFNGACEERNANGLKLSGDCRLGQRVGKWYSKTSETTFETWEYLKGEEKSINRGYGIDVYYDTFPTWDYSYYFDKKNGPYKLYDKEGKLESSGDYDLGDKIGIEQFYNAAGQIIKEVEHQKKVIKPYPIAEEIDGSFGTRGPEMNTSTLGLDSIILNKSALFDATFTFWVDADGKAKLHFEKVELQKKVSKEQYEQIKNMVIRTMYNCSPAEKNRVAIESMYVVRVIYK